MELTELISNLPTYILFAVFFSYLLWSKYFKNDKLRMTDANDLLKIISIFFILLPSMLGISLVLLMILATLKMSFDFILIWEMMQGLVVTINLLLLYFLVIYHRNVKAEEKDFNKIMGFIFIIFLIVMSILMGFYITLLFNSYAFLLPYILFTLAAFCLIFLVVIIIMINVFEFKVETTWKDILLLFTLVAVLTVVFAFIWVIAIPQIVYEAPIESDYYVYESVTLPKESYLQIVVPISVKTRSLFTPLLDQIPVYYGKYNIETQGKANENFRIHINTSWSGRLKSFITSFEDLKGYNSKRDKKFGFFKIDHYEKSNLAVIRTEGDNIRTEGINKLILSGFRKVNLTDADFYLKSNSNFYEVCKGNQCRLTFNIMSKVDKPLHYRGGTVLNSNRNGIAPKNCIFIKASVMLSDKNLRLVDDSCSGGDRSCDLQLRNIKDKGDILRILLDQDGGVIKLRRIDIERPINITAEFDLSCV